MATIRWLALVALGSVVATSAHAAVTAEVCNQTGDGLWVAYGYRADDTGKWKTTGWWWAQTHDCTGPVELPTDGKEIYVFANSPEGDLEWRGTMPLCVSLDAFELEDADSADCDEKRSFRKFTASDGDAVDVTLDDSDAVRAAYNFTLCN
ncbi:MAG: DUF1036 domain-containing protein, partial [Candidatus Binatia bacterium]